MNNSTVTTCSGTFYDPGGTGKYGNNLDYTMTFYPASANSNLRFAFTSFALEDETNCNYDYLKIFNGSTTGAPLIGKYCGSGTNSPGTVTASNETGSLTFVFHSDEAVNAQGWVATISCVSQTYPPVADFSAGTATPETGSTVLFTDLSVHAPTSWSWSFNPGTVTYVEGTSSSSQNPKVQFNNNGNYSVTLTASNTNGSDAETKSNYIHAGTPGLWTGLTSSDWNTPSNWSNYIVPTSATNVTLPSSAPNWPDLTQEMMLGSQCRNLVLDGSSELTVNGDFVINPGSSLTFSGPGLLKIAGDWSNDGTLNPGTGIIEFIGPDPAKITGGTDRISYVSNYNLTTFAKSMINLSGGTAGPAGDDASMDILIGFDFNYLGVSYSQARINTNGWISLNLTGDPGLVDNANLFNTLLPGTVLAPWWDDLKADGTSSISFKTEGSAPDRIFTVEWKKMLTYYQTGTTSRINFQLKLYETSDNIEFCYGDAEAGTHDLSESASIGIKDAVGGSGNFREATTGSSTTGVTDLKSPVNWPAVNYRFVPTAANEVFYNIIENKTNATLTVEPDIIVNGDLIVK